MKVPGPDHPITITENPPHPRDARPFIVAETTRALALKEAAFAPVQYIPREDVNMELLDRTTHQTRCPYKGDASCYRHGRRIGAPERGLELREPNPAVSRIAGHMAFRTRSTRSRSSRISRVIGPSIIAVRAQPRVIPGRSEAEEDPWFMPRRKGRSPPSVML